MGAHLHLLDPGADRVHHPLGRLPVEPPPRLTLVRNGIHLEGERVAVAGGVGSGGGGGGGGFLALRPNEDVPPWGSCPDGAKGTAKSRPRQPDTNWPLKNRGYEHG
jgi:hypothetical protein